MKKHDSLPPKFWICSLLIILFTCLDIMVFLYPIPGQWTLHILLSILFIIISTLLITFEADARFLLPFALFLTPLGPPGAIVICVALLFYLIDLYITQSISNLLFSIFPPLSEESSERVYDRLIYHLDDPRPERIPIPFKDIMMYGNYNQKRMAIEKMLRYFTPEFAEALKMGLKDESAAIKVQTATALSSIDHQMFDHYLQLKTLHEEFPGNRSHLKKYIEYGSKYALSKILDEDRLKIILEQIIPAYNAYIKENEQDHTAKLALAELYVKNGDDVSAKNLLLNLLQESFKPAALYLLLHVLFNLKDYNFLREKASEAKEHLKDLPKDNYVRATVTLWQGGSHE